MLAELRKNPLKAEMEICVFSFFSMCVIWIVTGFRFDIAVCLKIFFCIFIALSVVFFGYYSFFDYKTDCEASELAEYYEKNGFDDFCFEQLEKLIAKIDGGKPDGENRLFLASVCAKNKKHDKCREILDETDFEELDDRMQNEFFNIHLYNALLEGDISLAEEIYRRASFYFDRAMMRKNIRKSPEIAHTIGTLEFSRGNFEKADELFLKARYYGKKELRCECDLSLAWSKLNQGDFFQADVCIKKCEKSISGRKQTAMLEKIRSERIKGEETKKDG